MHPIRYILIAVILTGFGSLFLASNSKRQPNIPMPDHMSQAEAKAALDGHDIYTDTKAFIKSLLP